MPTLSPSPLLGRPLQLGTSRRRFFSYDDIEDLVLAHRHEVLAQGYAQVVALLRGGAYAAAMLSQCTGLPLATARFDRTSGRVECELGPAPSPRTKVLLVEDVAGKGWTLARTREHLLSLGYDVHVFVVCWDALSRVQPEYGIRLPAGERYVFPWERSLLQETSAQRREADSDTAGWRTGFDFDGVFVEDLPAAWYALDLEATLTRRDGLAPLPPPPLWRDGGLIVSGRLEQDRERTLAWLNRHGFNCAQLLLRPSEDEAPGEFKKRMCVEHALCEFVESDFEQAALIAQLPHVVVWHWEQGRMRRVRA